MSSLEKQVLMETFLSPEVVDQYLETTWHRCEEARKGFLQEHPDWDPSSFDNLRRVPVNTHVEKGDIPTLEEYRAINGKFVNLRGSTTWHPSTSLTLLGNEPRKLLNAHYEIVRNKGVHKSLAHGPPHTL